MALPTNIPDLRDVTSIVVGDLSCDGIEASVLTVIGFLVQLESLERRLESEAVKKFTDSAQDSWQSFVNQFASSVQGIWDQQLSDFEKWLADAEQGNIVGGIGMSFGPQGFLEPANQNDFAIFDYDSTIGNILDPGGTHKDLIAGVNCEAGIGFSLASSFTSSFGAVISSKLNVAGQLASFGSTLVDQASLFIEGLAETASQLATVVDGNEVIFDAMLRNANDIVDRLETLTETSYEEQFELLDFGRLLDLAIQDLKDAEQRFASGDTDTDKARDSLTEATAWICESDGPTGRGTVTLAVTSLVALFQAQVDLFKPSFTRLLQLSLNITNHRANLREETRFQPTYANFFTKTRCGLEKIQQELGSINQQNSLLFQVKRMEWCAVMKTYEVMLSRYHPERFAVDLELEFETQLGEDVEELGVSLSTQAALQTNADAVVAASRAFLDVVQIKLRRNIAIELVELRRDALKKAIDEYKAEAQEAKDAIAGFLVKAGVQDARETANTFFTAAQAVVALAPLAKAMIDGEYNTMFTLDGLNSQLNDIVAQVVSKAVECCEEEGANDARSKAGLAELRQAQERANDDARAAAFDAHFGSPEVVPNSSLRILFDLRELKKVYSQFKRLMQIPCLGNIGDVAKII